MKRYLISFDDGAMRWTCQRSGPTWTIVLA